MNKEDYKVLKEIGSLNQKKNELKGEIIAEEKRVQRIIEMRENAKEEIEEIQLKRIEIQKSLASAENNIEQTLKLIEKAKYATSSAKNENELNLSSKQKKQGEEKLSKFEMEAMEYLETIEELESHLKDKQEFLVGSQATLGVLEKEVSEVVSPKKQEIEVLNKRTTLLEESLEKDIVLKLEKLTAKNLTHGPLTKIENNICYICKFSISQVDQRSIEKDLKLRTCSGCSRIFIPNSTLY